MNYKTKRTLKQILSVALAGLAAFGAIFGLVKLSEKLKEETKVIHPSFSVGGLNANGEYEETDGSIYTKESFECQGMSVKLDFDSNVSYQAFYYDDLDKYISSSSVYEESMDLAVPETAVYARLEVTPIWADDVEEEDQVVHWYNVAKYANQLEISVLKDQTPPEVEPVALFETLADYDLPLLADSTSESYRVSPLSLTSASFIYSDNHFENKTVSKIGVPIATLASAASDCHFTVCVIKEASTYTSVEIVEEYTLTIKANEYSSNSLNEWVYFDVNIPIGAGETLMFGRTTDTIVPHYDRKGNESGALIWRANTADSVVFPSTGSLLFDIYVNEVK